MDRVFGLINLKSFALGNVFRCFPPIADERDRYPIFSPVRSDRSDLDVRMMRRPSDKRGASGVAAAIGRRVSATDFPYAGA